MRIVEQSLEESNAYSLFVYAIRSQVTRDYYLRKLRIFFNHINLEPDLTMEERCNYFAKTGTNDPSWTFNCIVKFLQYQKDRVEKEEITGATLRNFMSISENIQKELKRANRSRIRWEMQEIQYRLVKGEKNRDIMRTVMLSERNYYKYKKKISLQLEQIQKERTDSAIWLEVQSLKDRMSNLYLSLYERNQHPHTKTNELPNLVSTAESVAINILKLQVASITAIKQSNVLESQVNTQLPSTSKYKELPKISYSNNREESGLLEGGNTMAETTNNKIIYED